MLEIKQSPALDCGLVTVRPLTPLPTNSPYCVNAVPPVPPEATASDDVSVRLAKLGVLVVLIPCGRLSERLLPTCVTII